MSTRSLFRKKLPSLRLMRLLSDTGSWYRLAHLAIYLRELDEKKISEISAVKVLNSEFIQTIPFIRIADKWLLWKSCKYYVSIRYVSILSKDDCWECGECGRSRLSLSLTRTIDLANIGSLSTSTNTEQECILSSSSILFHFRLSYCTFLLFKIKKLLPKFVSILEQSLL